jgi:hypothetical protein
MNRTGGIKPALAGLLAVIWLAAACSPLQQAPPALEQALPALPAPATRPAQVVEATSATETAVPSPAFTVTAAPSASPTVSLTPAPTVYAVGPRAFPAGVNPLTGLPAADPARLERRPVAVKITLFPRSVRPQFGFSRADQVWEYAIGDFMSRFVGIFYGQDAAQVGPVRSARFFDERLMRMYRAFFVFGWADDPVLAVLQTDELRRFLVVEQPEGCPPLCRIGAPGAYNTLFANTAAVTRYVVDRRNDNSRQTLEGLRYSSAAPPSGSPAEALSVRYSLVSYHRWEYNPLTGSYLRQQDAEDEQNGAQTYAPLIDALTGEQAAAANVIVLFTAHGIFYQSSSTQILTIPFLGDGQGYALRDGWIYPIRWERRALDELPRLTLPTGELYPLKPGQTWFVVVGNSSAFTRQGEAGWRIAFVIP